eukprot:g76.t1
MGLCSGKNKTVDGKDVQRAMNEAAKVHREQGGTSLHMSRLEVKQLFLVYEDMKKSCGHDKISRKDFQNYFKIEDKRDLVILFDIFDKDESDSIELKELISGLSFLCKGSLAEKLRFVFNLFDKDGSGALDREEVEKMHQYLHGSMSKYHKTIAHVKAKGITDRKKRTTVIQDADKIRKSLLKTQKPTDHMKTEYANRIFAAADKNNDGAISFEEYLTWVTTDATAKDFLKGLEDLTDHIVEQKSLPISHVHHVVALLEEK